MPRHGTDLLSFIVRNQWFESVQMKFGGQVQTKAHLKATELADIFDLMPDRAIALVIEMLSPDAGVTRARCNPVNQRESSLDKG